MPRAASPEGGEAARGCDLDTEVGIDQIQGAGLPPWRREITTDCGLRETTGVWKRLAVTARRATGDAFSIKKRSVWCGDNADPNRAASTPPQPKE